MLLRTLSRDDGLSLAMIIGLVIGVVMIFAFVIGSVYCFKKHYVKDPYMHPALALEDIKGGDYGAGVSILLNRMGKRIFFGLRYCNNQMYNGVIKSS